MRRVTFYIAPDLSAGLKTIKERDGVPESEQIRRGIRLWLETKGITPKEGGLKKKQ